MGSLAASRQSTNYKSQTLIKVGYKFKLLFFISYSLYLG